MHMALLDRAKVHQRGVDPTPVQQVVDGLEDMGPVLVMGDLGLGQFGVSILGSSRWLEAQATHDVIIGMIPVFGYFARFLIDPGATHSFIAHRFVPYASVKPTLIAGRFSISLPTEDVLFADMVFKDSFVQVGNAVLEADLIPLDLVDLDFILGME
ncbi:hypothetical protein L3X38_017720 [Prunus dulcis]|uniref:Uncharacterized protein n=1 Tax=Prunus dulcis TaxID=3755 RepID=A0AAD4W9F3_PRUDU|nr:hypothetical protein L3X38_017720 [Prunus dulcis]